MTENVSGDIGRIVAHEAGHAVAAWASPGCPAPCLIVFETEKGEAACGVEPWPEPTSDIACLELASFFLGGIAGETVAFKDFERCGGTDLAYALEMARRHRSITGAPRRRARRSQFLRALPSGIFSELHGFLNKAYDLAVSRIKTHLARHGELRKMLEDGHAAGKLSYDAAELAVCLGPRPHPQSPP